MELRRSGTGRHIKKQMDMKRKPWNYQDAFFVCIYTYKYIYMYIYKPLSMLVYPLITPIKLPYVIPGITLYGGGSYDIIYVYIDIDVCTERLGLRAKGSRKRGMSATGKRLRWLRIHDSTPRKISSTIHISLRTKRSNPGQYAATPVHATHPQQTKRATQGQQ